jgi:hypothetical protein
LLSPAPSACLERAYPSSQKGGTLIAEDVLDLETHHARLSDANAYRPSGCGRCGAVVHVHDRRSRVLFGEQCRCTDVLRFRCSNRSGCGATWQVLPAFLARHLWRRWRVVEETIEEEHDRSRVPARTRRRWRVRLATGARQVVAVLATGAEAACAVAAEVGLEGCRFDLVRRCRELLCPAPGACLAELGALVHRLCPGVRVM